ncbi:quaternary amine ABC transporter ATP-binding protein [Amorphus orientalis]|uniref:Quaternary amine transport ATP-binding protein n=1 Tax=Amorphus orientalis TaxID=649198 RepID=A0AAE3VKN0_9HYPH|nr:betaine/proline/choline family ABC transporter ATP-binding protein [Amorphus orientalis]MDQ0313775.1 glycine betaine/proline transport system ATP-binding protein [Amorphus orientalis]
MSESVTANQSASPLSADSDDDRSVKLSCKGLWKIFGDDADEAREFLERYGGRPSSEALDKAGLTPAVRDASLDVHDGEIFVIMGLSGSGKSTIIRCLSLLLQPTVGELVFEGQDLLACSRKELIDIRRHKMGMVFQHFALLPHLTVLGNVTFPLEIQGVDRATREQRAMEVIELVGLGGRELDFPRALSGGQQQRVGIARSLASEPELWFLDEPFSALDPLIRREMQDEFLRLQRLLHKSIVFITHDFDEAIRLADRIAIMNQGEIVQVGTPEDLVVRPATPYVEEFTRNVARSKVLSARSIMTAPVDGTDYGGEVKPGDRISSFAGDLVASGKPFVVVNRRGTRIGQVDREAVIAILAESA